MPFPVPRARSWIWGAIALVIGLTLYVCDDWIESLRIPSIQKSVLNYLEIIIMGPAMALLAFLFSEQRYLREASYKARIEHERQMRFHFLGRIAASVAHEMRNPLHNLILLNNELSSHVTASDQDLCARIRGNLQRLDNATHLIYELARRERYRIDGESLGTVAILNLVRQVSDELQAMASPPAALTLPDQPMELVAVGRLEGIRIILLNLLRNAIEAAAGGEVQVSYPEVAERVCIEIRNRGNIDPHVLTDDAELINPKPGGLGVGLAIARHLAVLYGGSVEISCDAGWVIAVLNLPRGA